MEAAYHNNISCAYQENQYFTAVFLDVCLRCLTFFKYWTNWRIDKML